MKSLLQSSESNIPGPPSTRRKKMQSIQRKHWIESGSNMYCWTWREKRIPRPCQDLRTEQVHLQPSVDVSCSPGQTLIFILQNRALAGVNAAHRQFGPTLIVLLKWAQKECCRKNAEQSVKKVQRLRDHRTSRPSFFNDNTWSYRQPQASQNTSRKFIESPCIPVLLNPYWFVLS